MLKISNAFVTTINNEFNHSSFKIYNIGSENGYTVKEIIDKTIKIYKELYPTKKINCNIIIGKRREGDQAITIANVNKIYSELGWKSKYSIENIIRDMILIYKT